MGRIPVGGCGGDGHDPDHPGGIVMMESIYTLCGIIAVSGIVMGMIGGAIWLLS